MKSLSEIETTSKRASRAMGFTWGEAEEVGKSIRLLELFGFPGVKNLNHYFQLKKKIFFEKIKLIDQVNKSDKSSYCPIILGISFIDQIKKLEILQKCLFKEIAYPILLLPFLSRCSEIIGKKILFKFDKRISFSTSAKPLIFIFLIWKNLILLNVMLFIDPTTNNKKK